MGWSLDIKGEGKDRKFKIWSSISGDYITEDWQSRDEILKTIFWMKFRNFAEEFVKTAETFPNQWSKKGEMKIIRERPEEVKAVYELLLNGSEEDFWNKFIEILDNSKINLDINDGESQVTNAKDE
jgi:hypothetical protein